MEVGGVGTLNELIRATKIGGAIAFIGVLAGPPPASSRLLLMVMQQQRLQGVTVGSVEDLQAMCDAISLDGMKPEIDKTFSFNEVTEAFAHMSSGARFGKIAIAIEFGRYGSLIPGLGVKLSNDHPCRAQRFGAISGRHRDGSRVWAGLRGQHRARQHPGSVGSFYWTGAPARVDPKQRLIIIMMIQVPLPPIAFTAVRYLAYQALSDSD